MHHTPYTRLAFHSAPYGFIVGQNSCCNASIKSQQQLPFRSVPFRMAKKQRPTTKDEGFWSREHQSKICAVVSGSISSYWPFSRRHSGASRNWWGKQCQEPVGPRALGVSGPRLWFMLKWANAKRVVYLACHALEIVIGGTGMAASIFGSNKGPEWSHLHGVNIVMGNQKLHGTHGHYPVQKSIHLVWKKHKGTEVRYRDIRTIRHNAGYVNVIQAKVGRFLGLFVQPSHRIRSIDYRKARTKAG